MYIFVCLKECRKTFLSRFTRRQIIKQKNKKPVTNRFSINMKKSLLSLLIHLPILASAQTEATLCINEIMQSNIDCLMVEHDFPDSWVELYNPTDDDISLNNYYIGTTNDVTSAFQITSTSIIKAKSHILILCDKESRDLHTDFRLESTNPGILYLFDASNLAVDSLSYPAMPAANIA